MSPQFAADVSLLLSAAAQPVVQDLLDANKLVREMQRSSAQSLHFHSFNSSWCLLRGPMRSSPTRWFSDRRLCDNSGSTEKLFGHGQGRRCQRDGVAILQSPEENCWIEQR